MDPRAAAVLAVGPFATMAGVLKQLPGGKHLETPMGWPEAAVHASVLLALIAAHALCYARWQPHAPNRILVNEFLTRLWFVVYGLLLVGVVSEYGGLFLVMAAAWAVASWCTHYLVLRRQERYDPGANIALLGLFLLGLALIGLICVKLALADAAAAL